MIYYLLYIIFFTIQTYGNENIIKIEHFPFTPCLLHLQFNSTGSVILPKYKETFTLPEGAWCIAETHYEQEKTIAWNEIWYEDKENVKKVEWSEKCIPETTPYFNVNFTPYFFAIRTLYSLTRDNLKPYINNEKKYFPMHSVISRTFVFSDTIFNIYLPDEILFEIATYVDYKTLFCILSCVSKQFEKFTKAFDTSFSIKKSIELNKPIYTGLVMLIISNKNNNVPINIFHDPRFSHQYFKEQYKLSIEEFLWNLSFKVDQKNDNTVLISSEARTDQQFIELLQVCSLNTNYSPKEILNTKAEQLLITLEKKYNEIYDRVINLDAFIEHNENKIYHFRSCDWIFEDEVKLINFFIYIWNKLDKLLNSTQDRKVQLFYNRPAILTILITLLYDNLNNQKITLRDIPSTFLEYARKIANPIAAVPSKQLSYFQKRLKDTLEKNITYRNYILFEDQETTQYSKSADTLALKKESSPQIFHQNNEQVLLPQSQNNNSLKLSNKQAILNRSENIITLLFVWLSVLYFIELPGKNNMKNEYISLKVSPFSNHSKENFDFKQTDTNISQNIILFLFTFLHCIHFTELIYNSDLKNGFLSDSISNKKIFSNNCIDKTPKSLENLQKTHSQKYRNESKIVLFFLSLYFSYFLFKKFNYIK